MIRPNPESIFDFEHIFFQTQELSDTRTVSIPKKYVYTNSETERDYFEAFHAVYNGYSVSQSAIFKTNW